MYRSLWQSHPYLSCLLRPFQSTSPGLSHKPAILHRWCRDTLSPVMLFHGLLLPAYCTFQDLQVLLETFETNASLLERSTQDRDNPASAAALTKFQHCKLQLSWTVCTSLLVIPLLWQIPNRGTTTSSIKQDLPASRLRYRQFLGKVIEPRYVIYAVLVHHASQLGIHHLGETRRQEMSNVSVAISWNNWRLEGTSWEHFIQPSHLSRVS